MCAANQKVFDIDSVHLARDAQKRSREGPVLMSMIEVAEERDSYIAPDNVKQELIGEGTIGYAINYTLWPVITISRRVNQ